MRRPASCARGSPGSGPSSTCPDGFPDAVTEEAEAAARDPRLPSYDVTELAFLTIDPPGSTDLDQAMHLERRASGYRLRYAIADVAAFVAPGDEVDAEAHRRVETLYSPDTRTPLHPPCCRRGSASLLPGETRPARCCGPWSSTPTASRPTVEVQRALVRSRDRLDYADVQQRVDSGTATTSGWCCSPRWVGCARRSRASGAVSAC